MGVNQSDDINIAVIPCWRTTMVSQSLSDSSSFVLGTLNPSLAFSLLISEDSKKA